MFARLTLLWVCVLSFVLFFLLVALRLHGCDKHTYLFPIALCGDKRALESRGDQVRWKLCGLRRRFRAAKSSRRVIRKRRPSRDRRRKRETRESHTRVEFISGGGVGNCSALVINRKRGRAARESRLSVQDIISAATVASEAARQVPLSHISRRSRLAPR